MSRGLKAACCVPNAPGLARPLESRGYEYFRAFGDSSGGGRVGNHPVKVLPERISGSICYLSNVFVLHTKGSIPIRIPILKNRLFKKLKLRFGVRSTRHAVFAYTLEPSIPYTAPRHNTFQLRCEQTKKYGYGGSR